MKTHDREGVFGRSTATENKYAAMRDIVMTWDEISDELIWGNFQHGDPDDKPIDNERLASFCNRFPHFADRLREYVEMWNREPQITPEMVAAVEAEVTEEDVERTWRQAKHILDFYAKLRRVETERDTLKDDCMTLVLRLMGEQDDTFAPETREVMNRWRPKAEAFLKEQSA